MYSYFYREKLVKLGVMYSYFCSEELLKWGVMYSQFYCEEELKWGVMYSLYCGVSTYFGSVDRHMRGKHFDLSTNLHCTLSSNSLSQL